MVIGEFRQKLGEKSRIAFPKKFRSELGSSLVISKGYEKCLILMSPAQWQQMADESIKGPFVSSMIRDTRRFLFASASEVELDSQGRFVIPSYLKAFASIDSEGIFLGLGNWVELWSVDLWGEKLKEIENGSSDIADRLAGIQGVSNE